MGSTWARRISLRSNWDSDANVCRIKVPAPGFALVFLTDSALRESNPTSTETFPTMVVTHTGMEDDPSALATSNGNRDGSPAGEYDEAEEGRGHAASGVGLSDCGPARGNVLWCWVAVSRAVVIAFVVIFFFLQSLLLICFGTYCVSTY